MVSTAPLPVTLTAFTAAAAGLAAVRLAWATASETNSARFEVERSPDGRSFAAVSSVAAAGSSAGLRRYAYLDYPPTAGLLYYRLRLVDLDGTTQYSPVRTVAAGAAAEAGGQLFPNPGPAGLAAATLLLAGCGRAPSAASKQYAATADGPDAEELAASRHWKCARCGSTHELRLELSDYAGGDCSGSTNQHDWQRRREASQRPPPTPRRLLRPGG